MLYCGVQTDCDATVNRLRTELTNTQNEMQAMKNDIGAASAPRNSLSLVARSMCTDTGRNKQ